MSSLLENPVLAAVMLIFAIFQIFTAILLHRGLPLPRWKTLGSDLDLLKRKRAALQR